MAKVKVTSLSAEFLQSALARCILQHNSPLALLCLEQGENPHLRCQATGSTLFHLICMEASPMTEVKYVPFVYMLSNAGLDLDRQDFEGVTPLQLAIRCGLLELMTALLKCGAQCQGDEELLAERYGGLFFTEFISTLRKLTPGYWQAVEQNNTFRVNKLVKSWCRVNLTRNGQSLIEFAKVTAEDPKLIRHLVDNEASVELAHAVIAGDASRMNFILCNQAADLSTKDLSHKENFFDPYSPLTLYGAALKYGHKHLLDQLRSIKDTGRTAAERKEEGGQRSKDGAVQNERGQGKPRSVVCEIL